MADWRLVLCDRAGNPLEAITQLARDRQFQYRLNRPNRLQFTVPSDDPRVAGRHSDGFPKLDSGRRVVKAYRREYVPADGRWEYVIRFAGPVWQVQDVGDEGSARTAVSCTDPLAILARRFTDRRVTYTAQDGGTIARALLDAANAVSPTGLTTAGGRVEGTPTRSVTYQRKDLQSSIYELASAYNGFDFDVAPLDRTDGILARFDVYARRGANRPGAVFGWGIAPHNVKRVERMLDMEQAANSVLGLGATITGADQLQSPLSAAARTPTASPGKQDAGSIGQFGLLEAVDVFQDITDQAYLDALVNDELSYRVARRELVQFVPVPVAGPIGPSGQQPASDSVEPLRDWWLGDTVPLYVGARLRGGFQGIQRVYGVDLVIDDDGREMVNGIYAQQQ